MSHVDITTASGGQMPLTGAGNTYFKDVVRPLPYHFGQKKPTNITYKVSLRVNLPCCLVLLCALLLGLLVFTRTLIRDCTGTLNRDEIERARHMCTTCPCIRAHGMTWPCARILDREVRMTCRECACLSNVLQRASLSMAKSYA